MNHSSRARIARIRMAAKTIGWAILRDKASLEPNAEVRKSRPMGLIASTTARAVVTQGQRLIVGASICGGTNRWYAATEMAMVDTAAAAANSG